MDLLLEADAVITIDLDDTLYPERTYVRSGFRAISCLLEELYGIRTGEMLWEEFQLGNPDAIGTVCSRFGLPSALRGELLQVYRCHTPEIECTAGARALLARLQALGMRLAVITDGRAVSQRQKLKALGLLEAFSCLVISEEQGFGKPDPRCFERVMESLPARDYVYIADNPAKDFVAANSLGWQTIGLADPGSNIHRAREIPSSHQPRHWVGDLCDLNPVIKS
jgi:putative hydrolase of the HAD superfamily